MVHGCLVYTEHAEMATVSCGTSHASTVSTPLWWIFKNMLFTHVDSHASAVGLLKSANYIKAINNNNQTVARKHGFNIMQEEEQEGDDIK